MRASASSSTCRSASSRASRRRSRAWPACTYIMDAARSVTTGAIDGGEKPSVPSAMLKYHCTELGRQVANDAMDVHGGKGICLGPKNYLGRGYQVVPVAITVEGANILTRSLIIFGQGAIRCHPFVLKEMDAAKETDKRRACASSTGAVRPHRLHALERRALVRAGADARALHATCRTPARRAATTSTSTASARRSRSPPTSRCSRSAAT